MYNVLSSHIYNNENLLLVQNSTNNLFNIQFNSNNILFKCEKCIKGVCLMDNQDWVKSKIEYNRYLFKNDIMSFDIINSIYKYISSVFEYLVEYNFNELKYIFSYAEFQFISYAYNDELVFLLIYTQYLIDLGIFTREFYSNFKLKSRYGSCVLDDMFLNMSLNNTPIKEKYKYFFIDLPLNYYTMFNYLDAFLFNLKEFSLFRYMFNNTVSKHPMDDYLKKYYTVDIPNFNYDTFIVLYGKIKEVLCIWNKIMIYV